MKAALDAEDFLLYDTHRLQVEKDISEVPAPPFLVYLLSFSPVSPFSLLSFLPSALPSGIPSFLPSAFPFALSPFALPFRPFLPFYL
jgi:hypothetical protein